MEVGGKGGMLYTYHYTVTTKIPAVTWSAMRAILMFQWEVMDKVKRQCPQTTTFFEKKGELKRYQTEVLPLTSLTPYH